jgi:ankyrin repeat protein
MFHLFHQVSPVAGFSCGETTFRAVARGWIANTGVEDPNKEQSLRFRYGICDRFDCEGGGVLWVSEFLEPQDGFEFGTLPAGEPTSGNLTTVQLCAVKMLGGEVLTSQTCLTRHVEVTRPASYQMFTSDVLASALQSPTLRLQAATIAAEQIAITAAETRNKSRQEPNMRPSLPHMAVVDAMVDMIAANDGGVVSQTMLSGAMSVLRQLATSIPLLPDSSPLPGGAVITALASGASRLLDASAGDVSASLTLADEFLSTLAAILALGNLDGVGAEVTLAQAMARLNSAISHVGTAVLEGMVVSSQVLRVGSDALSLSLYKGDTGELALRTIEVVNNSEEVDVGNESNSYSQSTTQTAGIERGNRRILRRLQQTAARDSPPITRIRSVATRRGTSEVTLEGFTGPGCGSNTTVFPDLSESCLPMSASLRFAYIADSSYIVLGLGEEEFRRAVLVNTRFPLSDTHTVHTASGVFSVAGDTGAIVPMLAIQLPLDMQTGLSDLREDNKFCARVDYQRMVLVFVGGVKIVTSLREYPTGYNIESHTAVCWADMYADYVVVQVSQVDSVPKRFDFVQPRTGHQHLASTAALVNPGPLSDGVESLTSFFAATAAALFLLLMAIVFAVGLCERLRSRPLLSIGSLRNVCWSFKESGDADVGAGRRSVRWATDRAMGRDTASPSAVTASLGKMVLSPSRKLDHLYSTAATQEGFRGASTVPSLMATRTTWTLPWMGEIRLGSDYELMSNATSITDEISAPPTPITSRRPSSTPVTNHHGLEPVTAGRLIPESASYLDERHNEVTDSLCGLPLHSADTSSSHCDCQVTEVKFADVDALAMDSLTLGADLSRVDPNGRSPLHNVARAGRAQLVKVLLRRAGNGQSEVDINLTDCRGQTPLHLAAEYGHLSVVRALLSTEEVLVMDVDGTAEEGGDDNHGVRKEVEADEDSLTLTKVMRVEVGKEDNSGCTALHLAAHFGHCAVVGALLERSSALKVLQAEDHFGNTPLHHAAMQGHTDTVLALLSYSSRHDMHEDCALQRNNRWQVRMPAIHPIHSPCNRRKS